MLHSAKGNRQIGNIFLQMMGTFLCWVFVTACGTANSNHPEEIKIAKTVPLVYVNTADKRFSRKEDTLYFDQHWFSGYAYTLYPGGDTAAVGSYFNGVEEGWQRKWYPARQPAEERFYINGKKEGLHRGWWADGTPKFYFTAINDEYDGLFREWYATGRIGKEFHYVHGREEGSEKLWWDNGTIRANYVVHQGKKYGLIGLKTCSNPYDSILKK